MKIDKLSNMTRGWFIGNFTPSVYKTEGFEVGIGTHKKGEVWPRHYHKISTEYNVLLSGSLTICGETIDAGTIFIIEPNEIAEPIFHEECTIVTVKIPGVLNDKYIV